MQDAELSMHILIDMTRCTNPLLTYCYAGTIAQTPEDSCFDITYHVGIILSLVLSLLDYVANTLMTIVNPRQNGTMYKKARNQKIFLAPIAVPTHAHLLSIQEVGITK